MKRIEEIYAILGATVAQLIPSDDQIISDNIKKAAFLAREEMREQLKQGHADDGINRLREALADVTDRLESASNWRPLNDKSIAASRDAMSDTAPDQEQR